MSELEVGEMKMHHVDHVARKQNLHVLLHSLPPLHIFGSVHGGVKKAMWLLRALNAAVRREGPRAVAGAPVSALSRVHSAWRSGAA